MFNRSKWRRWAAWFSLGIIYVSPVTAQTWTDILHTIRKKFPDVRQLSTIELASWLADTNRPAPVLIDARTAAEYGVSHLPAARRLDSLQKIKAAGISNAAPIVVYCSVGYRSSSLAAKLQNAGFTQVYNLEGSIFAWANEGRPVFRGDREMHPPVVHPYSAKWGQLLKEQYHPGKR